MERYDAILEQLRKAQSRGMETITNRLDVVVQNLEELISEAKSSVQGALPDSANEVFPVDEIEATLDSYRQQADAQTQRCAVLESKIEDLEQATGSEHHGVSITLMRSLDGAESQSELLKELLPAISENSARAVVFVLRDGKVSAWSGIGFADGEILRSWQGDVAESSALSKLLEVSRPVRFAPEEDDLFRGWFANQVEPREILLIPVVLRGKLMGTVYIDRLDGHPWDPDTAQTLVAQVCLLIDTLQFRQTAAPSLAEAVEIGHVAEAVAPEEPSMDEEPEAEGEVEIEEPDAEDQTEPVAAATQEPEGVDPNAAVIADPEIDPSATMKIDVPGVGASEMASEDEVVTEAAAEIERQAEVITAGYEAEESTAAEIEEPTEPESFDPEMLVESKVESEVGPEPEPEFEPAPEVEPAPEFEPEPEVEPAPEFEPEPAVSGDDIGIEEPAHDEPPPAGAVEAPSQVQMPVTPPKPEEAGPSGPQFLDEPPPVQPVQPPAAEPEEEVSEDGAQREEARRFARLLVSEIKLYNEEQVERGRESGDIYHRLREDIDRSREMFEKRISAEVRGTQDYFQDELVRVLADGDPDLLGM